MPRKAPCSRAGAENQGVLPGLRSAQGPRSCTDGGLQGPPRAPETPELEGALGLNWVIFHLFLPSLSSPSQPSAGSLLGGEKLGGTIGTESHG